jgi:hypothetical protein
MLDDAFQPIAKLERVSRGELSGSVTDMSRRHDFQPLLRAVDHARIELARTRSAPDRTPAAVAAAQRAFRTTLESYGAAAEADGVSMPHRLRVELNVCRSLSQDP